MTDLHFLAQSWLFFAQSYFLFPAVILGYFLIDRQKFANIIALLCFTLVYNNFLKAYFQLPLPPTLGIEGFAFPSGHTHMATIFWAGIAIQYPKKWIVGLIAPGLLLLGVCMVYRGYHYPQDVFAAMALGCISWYIYLKAVSYPPFKENPPLFLILLSFFTLLMIVFTDLALRKKEMWIGQGALIGFGLGWLMTLQSRQTKQQDNQRQLQCYSLFTAIIGVAFFSFLFAHGAPQLGKGSYIFTQYFLIGFWVGGSPRIALGIQHLAQSLLRNKH